MEDQNQVQDPLLASIYVGRSFDSFEEVEDLMKQLSEKLFYSLMFKDKKTVESHNRRKGGYKIDPTKWKFHSARISCSHFGQHRDRSKGKRFIRNVNACGCPFQFYVSFNRYIQKYRIMSCTLRHEGHPISAEFARTHRVKRKLKPEALNFAEKALAAGANVDHVRKQLSFDFGIDLQPKFLHNIKQKVVGLKKDEWIVSARLLNDYARQPGNIVKIFYGDDNVIDLIYVQSAKQREFFLKYGELLEFDGTYKTNRLGMPLYTLMVIDNFGVGQPVAIIFMKEETPQNIKLGLNTFREYNDGSQVKVFITDKDCNKLTAIEEMFPDAVSLLCIFHVLSEVEKRLVSAGLHQNEKDEIYADFRSAVYADSFEEINRLSEILCKLELDRLGEYFQQNWFNIVEKWAVFYRKNLFIMGSHTTNRLERFHSTVKKQLHDGQVRFPQLLTTLLDISTLLEKDRDRKSFMASLRFTTEILPPFLEMINKEYTPFAAKQVAQQYIVNKTTYTSFQADTDTFVVINGERQFIVTNNFSKCTCSFSNGYGLPCRHMIFLAGQAGKLMELRGNPRWLIKDAENAREDEKDLPCLNNWMPITEGIATERRKVVTREEKFMETHLLFQSLANAMQDLSGPTYEKYITTFRVLQDCIQQQKDFQVAIVEPVSKRPRLDCAAIPFGTEDALIWQAGPVNQPAVLPSPSHILAELADVTVNIPSRPENEFSKLKLPTVVQGPKRPRKTCRLKKLPKEISALSEGGQKPLKKKKASEALK